MDPKNSNQSFESLISKEFPTLYRLARVMVWDRNSSEDVVQETVMKAYQNFRTYRAKASFKAWIYKYLVYTIFNRNKGYLKRKSFFSSIEDGSSIPDLEKKLGERKISCDLFSTNTTELYDDLDEKVAHSIKQLCEQERLAFLLKVIGGFTYTEISNMMDVPQGTLMSYIFRARRKLKESLMDYGSEHGLLRI